MAAKKGGLGKGYEALFSENALEDNGTVELKLSEIEPNLNQPRKDFDEEALSALADSISKHGLLQPIVVRPKIDGSYEIVAGERRWRASRMAGLVSVPVIIKEMDEQTASEIALVENLQREDLNPYEEALGYHSLMEAFGMTQEKVAERVGKSRTAVTNALRLLKLDDYILAALRAGDITAGHARALLSAKTAEQQKEMFRMAKEGASVRALEEYAKTEVKQPKTETRHLSSNNFYTEVALSLKEELHRPVKIKSTGKGKGTITLSFYSDDELKDFASRLAGE